MALESGEQEAARRHLPRPFLTRPWSGDKRVAAEALWGWHLALHERAALARWDPSDADRAERGEAISWLDQSVAEKAYAACNRHGLDRALLAEQVRVLPQFVGPITFEDAGAQDASILSWAGSHAHLLAALADAAHSWQIPHVHEFSRGLFLVGRLMELRHDAEAGRFFVPLADLAQAGVDRERLVRGGVDEPVRRLLWKQLIRARDALAQGTPLVNELEPRFARAFKRWWMAGVEVLNTIERRDFDVWSRPVELTPFQRLQVGFQARFGRTTFRG